MENGYVAFYNGKRVEVYAASSYKAQQKAIEFFKPPKSKQHMVHVHLAEKPDYTVEVEGTMVAVVQHTSL